jgi:DNA-binding SARP family transcriptional activator
LRCGDQIVSGLEAQKTQELLCYLLLNRGRAYVREKLADVLWSNSSGAQSRKYLRQALWQLQTVLDRTNGAGNSLLVVESDWLHINPAADFWMDVYQFEQAVAMTRGRQGKELSLAEAQSLRAAVQLYRGDLLENWYQDWCLLERERLQNMYLASLDKLMDYCEAQPAYEDGIAFGEQILRSDRARERTYRRLMRLYYLAGDRTGALRQYEHCAAALNQELGVRPAGRTIALYMLIRTDQGLVAPPLSAPQPTAAAQTKPEISNAAPPTDPDVLGRLYELRATLASAYRQVEEEIEAIRLVLSRH